MFQLPSLPTNQAQRQPWQRPTVHPTLKILYPSPLAQPADPPVASQPLCPHHQQQHGPPGAGGYPTPKAVSTPSAATGQSDGAISGTPEAEEDAEQSPATSAQAATCAPKQHPAALTAAAYDAETFEAEADRAAEGDAAVMEGSDAEGGKAAAAGGAGPFGAVMEEGANCGGARGLRPRAVARALAGPTVHILLEGYVSLTYEIYAICTQWLVLGCCKPMFVPWFKRQVVSVEQAFAPSPQCFSCGLCLATHMR